ncbi:alkaline phosphatase family protein [Archangium violaceum]|uniref:alkaline phosphatase D family protein n=1 Tax=Archangium violaceum TaxID=83451 RepID=UPI00194F234A|nr:alkaline phosphatase D family protein [Archangium violaceum]QRO01305.1 alkaline phosphatase family protein [Archangium violaceum]
MARPLITTIGYCTSTTARICVTAKDGLSYARLVFRSGDGSFQSREARLSQPTGSTFLHGTFDLDGLAESSTVEYAVAVSATPEGLPSLSQLSQSGGLGRFRLLPPPGQPLRIGLVSCNGGYVVSDHVRRHAMWKRLGEVVAAGEVDLLLHIGDQIYADHIREAWQRNDLDDHLSPENEELMRRLRESFRVLYCDTWQRPELAAVLGSVPSMMMWDDHDIFDGWGSHDEVTPADRAFFEAARTTFAEFQARLNPPAFSEHSYAFGWVSNGLGFLVLDARTHRSWKDQTIIGRRQWAEVDAWLEAQVPAGLKRLFVVTGVPPLHAKVAAASKLLEKLGFDSFLGDVRDSWMAPNNTEELRKLLNRLFEFRKRSPGTEVTSLSGDVHVGTTARLRSRVPFHKRSESDLPEITQVVSSGIGSMPPDGLIRKVVELGLGSEAVDMYQDLFSGRLLELPGNPDGRVLFRRNFAVLDLGASGKAGWDPDQNLRVRYYAEGLERPIEQTLLAL